MRQCGWQIDTVRSGAAECQLICAAVGYSFRYDFGHVIDGTRCATPGDVDGDFVCVEGQCVVGVSLSRDAHAPCQSRSYHKIYTPCRDNWFDICVNFPNGKRIPVLTVEKVKLFGSLMVQVEQSVRCVYVAFIENSFELNNL